jgi:hypothetical protein
MTRKARGCLSARTPNTFLRHQLVEFIGERTGMRNRPDARFNGVTRAVLRLHVAFDLESGPGGFADEVCRLAGLRERRRAERRAAACNFAAGSQVRRIAGATAVRPSLLNPRQLEC